MSKQYMMSWSRQMAPGQWLRLTSRITPILGLLLSLSCSSLSRPTVADQGTGVQTEPGPAEPVAASPASETCLVQLTAEGLSAWVSPATKDHPRSNRWLDIFGENGDPSQCVGDRIYEVGLSCDATLKELEGALGPASSGRLGPLVMGLFQRRGSPFPGSLLGVDYLDRSSCVWSSTSSPCGLDASAVGGEGPYVIAIGAYSFDPLKRLPLWRKEFCGTAESTQPADAEAYYIVQVNRGTPPSQLADMPFKLDEPLAGSAFLEKLGHGSVEKLEKSQPVRWISRLPPALKIDPNLRAIARTGKPSEVGQDLTPQPDWGSLEDTKLFDEVVVRLPPGSGQDAVQTLMSAASRVPRDEFLRSALGLAPSTRCAAFDRGTQASSFKVEIESVADLVKVGALPQVWSLERQSQVTPRNSTTSWVIQTDKENSRIVYKNGIFGANEMIGMIDGPLDVAHPLLRDLHHPPGSKHRKLFAYRGSSRPAQGLSADYHGTFVAGIAAGQDEIQPNDPSNGQAMAAKISFIGLGDVLAHGNVCTDLTNALELQYQDGARTFLLSWGDDNQKGYTDLSCDIDKFSRKYEDALVVVAESNSCHLTSPETAKDCLAVGASRQAMFQDYIGSGGMGEVRYRRYKPDVFAPGCAIVSAIAGGGLERGRFDPEPGGDAACGILSDCSTSWAAASAAGAAALVREYYKEGFWCDGKKDASYKHCPHAALIKATLLNGTVNMKPRQYGATDTYPSFEEGWGRIVLDRSLYFANDVRGLYWQDVPKMKGFAATGDYEEYKVTVAPGTGGPDDELKITLVWTDPASACSAPVGHLVNDLDLQLTAPLGYPYYCGNHFEQGLKGSVSEDHPCDDSVNVPDKANNVEQIVIERPAPGDYTIKVRASAIQSGPQGFALVATGNVTGSSGPPDISCP